MRFELWAGVLEPISVVGGELVQDTSTTSFRVELLVCFLHFSNIANFIGAIIDAMADIYKECRSSIVMLYFAWSKQKVDGLLKIFR